MEKLYLHLSNIMSLYKKGSSQIITKVKQIIFSRPSSQRGLESKAKRSFPLQSSDQRYLETYKCNWITINQ